MNTNVLMSLALIDSKMNDTDSGVCVCISCMVSMSWEDSPEGYAVVAHQTMKISELCIYIIYARHFLHLVPNLYFRTYSLRFVFMNKIYHSSQFSHSQNSQKFYQFTVYPLHRRENTSTSQDFFRICLTWKVSVYRIIVLYYD